jgi:hypothetical protein
MSKFQLPVTKVHLGLLPLVYPVKAQLKDFVNISTFPTPPAQIDYSLAMTSDFTMSGNGPDPDNPPTMPGGAGDCFFAAATNLIKVATANAQATQAALSTVQTLKAYGLCTGFDPKRPQDTDNGTEPGQGFTFLQHTGIAGHKFGPVAQIDVTNEDLVRAAQFVFPGLMIGVAFPRDWEMAPVWDLTSSPIVGGHEIFGYAYDNTNPKVMADIESWAKRIPFTWEAGRKFITQLTVTIPPEWISDMNLAPSGLDLEQLVANEQAMGA